MKLFTLLLICLFTVSIITKGQMPETRIYVLDISKEKGKMVLKNPVLVSKQKGYNNQPFFSTDDESILFASNNGKGNTDIYKYNIKNKKTRRITKTSEAEYSPQQSLMEDNEISCVRVEKDTITQHFYAYNAKGKKGHLLLPDVKALGYYSWLTSAEIIGLTLPEPFTLVKMNTLSLKIDTLLESPGRTFYAKQGKVYFVDKSDSTQWFIKLLAKENLRLKKGKVKVENTIIVETLANQEDFAITYDNIFLMGLDGQLFAYYPKKANGKQADDWTEIADLKKLGIPNFYRLAVNSNSTKLAVVSYVGDKP